MKFLVGWYTLLSCVWKKDMQRWDLFGWSVPCLCSDGSCSCASRHLLSCFVIFSKVFAISELSFWGSALHLYKCSTICQFQGLSTATTLNMLVSPNIAELCWLLLLLRETFQIVYWIFSSPTLFWGSIQVALFIIQVVLVCPLMLSFTFNLSFQVFNTHLLTSSIWLEYLCLTFKAI